MMTVMNTNPRPSRGPAAPARGTGHKIHSMRELKACDLLKGEGSMLPELIVAKLNTLDPEGFTERCVANKARLLLHLLRDTLASRYPHLSLPAFAEILLAMDHFIEVRDEIPDTHVGGFVDDLRKISEVTARHAREIEAYRCWRLAY